MKNKGEENINEDKTPQHVRVPHKMRDNDKLDIRTEYVYTKLKKYMNKDDYSCYPSLETLHNDTGYAINTIKKYLDILAEYNHIKIYRKRGAKTKYVFNPNSSLYKTGFEMFTMEFLNSTILNHREKAAYIALQELMFKNQSLGKICATHTEIAKYLGVSYNTWKTMAKNMQEAKVLTILESDVIDPKTHTKKLLFCFDLVLLSQAMLFKLQDHEDRITKIEADNSNTKELINSMRKEIEALKKEVADCHSTIRIQNNNLKEKQSEKQRELKQSKQFLIV